MKTLHLHLPAEFDPDSQFLKQLDNDLQMQRRQAISTERGLTWHLPCMVSLKFAILGFDTYVKTGLKPTRGWKVGTYKKMYGIKGRAPKLLEQLRELERLVLEALDEAGMLAR